MFCKMRQYICITLIVVCAIPYTVYSSPGGQIYSDFPAQRKEIVCGDSDVRRPGALTRIMLCTVIEGNLLIVMTRLPADASVPYLREITGFLVIYDLTGLDSLSKLFPNLTVIRGRSLISNFALVIRSTSLKTIGLRSLRVIQRGGVRVDLNTNLCYVRTINWSNILGSQTAAAAPVRLITNRLICPDNCQPNCIILQQQKDRPSDTPSHGKEGTRGHCWSSTHCQSICSPICSSRGLTCEMASSHTCCHEECLGGCYGPGPGACVACKGALHQGVCVSSCPQGTHLFMGRRCVTTAQCLNMTSSRRPSFQHLAPPSQLSLLHGSSAGPSAQNPQMQQTRRFATYQGRCVADCPSGHQRDEATGECVPCGDKCPLLQCYHVLINSLKSLAKLRDCYSVVDLYISIHEGDPALIKQQFDEAFSSLREVGSLKVIRASALTSLSFLRHIRRINVNPNRQVNATVFEIRGNDNLMELWPAPQNDSGIQIVVEGIVRFVLNRHLCPQRIIDLVKTGALVLPGGRGFRSEELELAQTSNGKLGFCETTVIPLKLNQVQSTSAVIQWPQVFDIPEARPSSSVLALVFYQAAKKNLTVYSSRTSCGSDSWKMIHTACNASFVPYDNVDGSGANTAAGNNSGFGENAAFCTKTLQFLKPATRYAVYVETKRLFSQRGAISNIVYFTTKPSNPSPPQLESLQPLNDSSIMVQWLPPLQSNGPLAVYILWFRAIPVDTEAYLHRDFCFAKPDWLSSASTFAYHGGLTRLTGTSWSVETSQRNICSSGQCESPISKAPSIYESPWMVDSDDGLLPIVLGVRPSRTIDDNEVGMVTIPARNQPSQTAHSGRKRHLTYVLKSLRGFTRYIVELQACHAPESNPGRFPWQSFVSTNHTNVKPTAEWTSFISRYCSHRVFKKQRTLSVPGADSILVESIRTEQDATGTVYVSWMEPQNPNGVILYYVLRYRRAELESARSRATNPRNNNQTTSNASQNVSLDSTDAASTSLTSDSAPWSSLCVTQASWRQFAAGRGSVFIASSSNPAPQLDSHSNSDRASTGLQRQRRSIRPGGGGVNIQMGAPKGPNTTTITRTHGGAELLNLLPGSYELQLMAVSPAGNSSWTPPLAFDISVSPKDTRLMVTAICLAGFAVLLALIVAVIIHRIRRKRLLDSEWQSANPEYWHVYEVDDWEMQLEDIDTLNFRYTLGRGNFGMVYRGVVKNLRTPAHSLYAQPCEIPAAIKTLSATSTVFDRRDFITEACYMKQFQNFHIVRLFGVVSKGSPSSSAGTTNPGTAANGSQKSRTNQPIPKQRLPTPLRRPFSCIFSKASRTCGGVATKQTVQKPSPEPPLPCVEATVANQQAANANGAATALIQNDTRREWAGQCRLACGSFTNLMWNQRFRRNAPVPKADKEDVEEVLPSTTVQHFSGTDSVKLFSQYGPFVVMELMYHGDLATYLRKLGDSDIGFVKPAQAYLWAVQIADGMAYLERKKYIHRDLAARNCLVDNRKVVKIGDFGLCRDIYERNYYHKVGAGKLPVRWMAPESLQSAYFTSRSDVWSFGVVLWEIATMACLPYQGKSHEEVVAYVLDGNTLVSTGAPINCPPLLQSVMLCCWAYRPVQRPTFLHLLLFLAPRFADAEFRQASYFYMGDPLTQQPPPCQDLEKSLAAACGVGGVSSSSGGGGVEFFDMPSLLKKMLGPPRCYSSDNGSGGSGSLSEDSHQVTTNFYSPSPHQQSSSVTNDVVVSTTALPVDRCSLDDGEASSC